MAQSDERSEVDRALDELVHQFADPLAFLRELVQNAVDAGSQEVEVRFEFQPDARDGSGATDVGALVVFVDDWGCGMDREIIQTRLTRLFASSKDGDLTKIGKFGVGFSSVFGFDPDAVCIDTSRGGESWRVLFDKTRTFKLIRRDEAFDGTKIQVIRACTRSEAENFVERGRAVLDYWCKHLKVELRCDGQPVNRPFTLEDAIYAERDDGFSHVVVGHRFDGAVLHGYYNQGLTLLEVTGQAAVPEGFDRPADLDHISFKVSSPHLEHTLTRDRVIQDDSYERAMATVRDVIQRELTAALADAWRNAVDGERARLSPALLWHLGRASDRGTSPLDSLALGTDANGQRCTVGQIRMRASTDEVFYTTARGELCAAVQALGVPILVLDPDDEASFHLLIRLCPGRARSLEERWLIAAPAQDPTEVARFAKLSDETSKLLRAFGAKVSMVTLNHFLGGVAAHAPNGEREEIESSRALDESAAEQRVRVAHARASSLPASGAPHLPRVAVTHDSAHGLVDLAQATALGEGWFARSRHLLVNADHDGVSTLIELAQDEPELAAYMLTKMFWVGTRLDAAADSKLCALAAEARWRRRGA